MRLGVNKEQEMLKNRDLHAKITKAFREGNHPGYFNMAWPTQKDAADTQERVLPRQLDGDG